MARERGRRDAGEVGQTHGPEEQPLTVHSRWDFTGTTYWVDLDELFQHPKTRRMLAVLKEMYERDHGGLREQDAG